MFLSAVKDIPYQKVYVYYKYNQADNKHCYTHCLLCLMVKANKSIVPGQWAVYMASSVLPNNPRLTEYAKQTKANITGYH